MAVDRSQRRSMADAVPVPAAAAPAPVSGSRSEATPAADDQLRQQMAGLDRLELAAAPPRRRSARAWSAAWPKLAALAIALLAWQLVVSSGWKPEHLLPGPKKVLLELQDMAADGSLGTAISITARRALVGFGMALVIGVVTGSLIARVRVLRSAFGSFITGLQTMPSIAWFPLAILLFQPSEAAIRFVVVLGAAPSIANGLISGADQVPPLLLRAGKALGAKGWAAFRHVVLPASLPPFLAGSKQGWAFAWRSLLAGELLVVIPSQLSIGVTLQNARDLLDAPRLLATMLVILVIGIIVDSVLFGTIERAVRKRWGLVGP
ncbi:MAG: ABC transporter permease [Acidimicrobiia bacterium]